MRLGIIFAIVIIVVLFTVRAMRSKDGGGGNR